MTNRMELIYVDIKEFKKNIYPEYLKLFPPIEVKPYHVLKRAYKKGIQKFIKIVNNGEFVGFIMTNNLEGAKYLQVDYIGILSEFQNKSYGTQAIKLLKQRSRNFVGILIEVETLGFGKNETENAIREKRNTFYKRLGFIELDFKLELYNVMFTPMVLHTSSESIDKNEIIKSYFEIYETVAGKRGVKHHCKLIK